MVKYVPWNQPVLSNEDKVQLKETTETNPGRQSSDYNSKALTSESGIFSTLF